MTASDAPNAGLAVDGEETPAHRLRSAGLRVTAVRLAVLGAVRAHPHGEVDVVTRAVEHELGSVSRQAIYDALHTLNDSGLVRRIEPAGSPARYESRVGDNHHHVVCRTCGATADIDCAVGAAPCLEPSSTHGYLLDEAEVTFWGICPACAISKVTRQPPADLRVPKSKARTAPTARGVNDDQSRPLYDK